MATPIADIFSPQGRTLVFQPRPGLGDLIWHLPILRAIAAATATGKVVLLTKRSTQADLLLDGDPAIERIVWFDRNPRDGAGRHDGVFGMPRLIADIAAIRARTAILLHHGTSLAAALRLAGIAHCHAYGAARAQRAWTRGPYPAAGAPFTEAFEQASAFAEALGLAGLPEPTVAVDAACVATIAARLASLEKPWTTLGIGSHGASRQWGAARFAALANALLERGPGSILLLAGPQDLAMADQITASITQAGRVFAARAWKLPEIAALLSIAENFIGNDSGLMNLRAAVGRPAYGLFGASGPLRHSVLIRPVIPPGGARAGMDRISLGDVLSAM